MDSEISVDFRYTEKPKQAAPILIKHFKILERNMALILWTPFPETMEIGKPGIEH